MADETPKPDEPSAPATPATPVTGDAPAPAAPAAAPAAAKPAAPAAAAKPAAPAAAAGAKPAAPAAKPAVDHAPKAAPATGPADQPPPADKPVPSFVASLEAAIPGSVSQVSYWVGDWTIIVPVEKLLEICRHLRAAPDALFDFCSDVTATDWPPRAERFDLVYCLYSSHLRHRVRVKSKVRETQSVPSVTPIWPSANWLEREVWDMFGIDITDHPDRRRILMPEDWQGFPQRKDYPLEGPGELLLENPQEWLKLRQAKEQADIE